MNVTTQLEFKLIYYNVAVQHISHYATKTPLLALCQNKLIINYNLRCTEKNELQNIIYLVYTYIL